MYEKSVFDVNVRKFYDEEELEEWIYEVTFQEPNQVQEVEITPIPIGNLKNSICFVVVIKHYTMVKLD